jgi:signal recognition particle receptor subunit beta
MVFFNWATMQMAAKIVYYGPGLCGKTSNLSYIYAKTSPKSRGEMVSLETESDRTLFFDLLPIEVGTIGGFKTRLQLYTVPGQVFYNTTRKLVLKGVDGLVFVADSQRPMRDANIESFKSLIENIEELGLEIGDLPLVLQFNKRDLENILSEDELNSDLNPDGAFSWHSASAINGEGVFETLKEITKVTLKKLRKRMAAPQTETSPRPIAPPAAPAPQPPPKKVQAATSGPAPISASSLAKAAEEGAGPDFAVPGVIDSPAFGEAEVQAPDVLIPDQPFEETVAPGESHPETLEDEVTPQSSEIPVPEEATSDSSEEASSQDEITTPSISELPDDEPFDQPPAEESEMDEQGLSLSEESLETIEEEEGDDVDDATVEFDTDSDETEAFVPPPVKRVHVSDQNDILSQLDDLRRQATETTFNRSRGGSGGKDLDLDSLLADQVPATRDIKRHIEHGLNSNLFDDMHLMQIAFRIQDKKGTTIHTLDPVVVGVDNASDLEKVTLQLTIDLANIK